MDKLFVFATYWNEIEWIDLSLRQLELMKPYRVIICDGCYDDKREIHSNDGTYEKIKQFALSHMNVTIIEPVRYSKCGHILNWFKDINIQNLKAFRGRLYYLYLIFRCNKYRLNQAQTFNNMMRMSGIEERDWFTTYDCDQFYSDDLISMVNNLQSLSAYDMIVGREKTFFENFNSYTEKYELRDYNNMPHRYYKDVCFIPTRMPVRNIHGMYKIYSNTTKNKISSGNIFHYRIKSKTRINDGYTLEDRKPPSFERTKCINFTGKHPSVIEKYKK